MTTTEKTIEESYLKIRSFVWRCILADDKKDRIEYGKKLLNMLEQSKQSSYKMAEIFDDMINKLVEAGRIIQEQNEWFDCLNEAMGKDRKNIIYAAATAQNVLKNYKKKRLNRKD